MPTARTGACRDRRAPCPQLWSRPAAAVLIKNGWYHKQMSYIRFVFILAGAPCGFPQTPPPTQPPGLPPPPDVITPPTPPPPRTPSPPKGGLHGAAQRRRP